MLPHDTNLEKSIIATCILNPEKIDDIVEIVNHGDFYRTLHQKVFEQVKVLFNAGVDVSVETIFSGINEKELSHDYGSKLHDILETHPVAVNPKYFAEKIKDLSVKRDLIGFAENLKSDCIENNETSNDLLDKIQTNLSNIGTGKKETLKDIKENLLTRLDIIKRAKKGEEFEKGLRTGFKDLDEILGGLNKSDLIVIAARPSMGKTALALNICVNVAKIENKQVDIFSLEMSEQQLSDRVLTSEARVNNNIIKKPDFCTDPEYKYLKDAADIIRTYPIKIDPTPGLHVETLKRKARKSHKKNGTGLIIIDYLQLMKGDKSQGRKDLEVGYITSELKNLAKELNVPIIILSQLNRALENRPNKIPVMSDLRESGAIEQDADIIMFIYRDEVYNKDENNPHKGTADIIIAKNRNGDTDVIKLSFQGQYTLFSELAKTQKDNFNNQMQR